MKQHRADPLWFSSGKDQTGHYTDKHHDAADSRNAKGDEDSKVHGQADLCEDMCGWTVTPAPPPSHPGQGGLCSAGGC